jgi:hypothetical protein
MITGEIVGVEQTQDAQKNIIIWICFTQDGQEIQLSSKTVGGRKAWPLYARFENFLGKTPEMIQKWIQINVEAQIGNIIKEMNCKEAMNAEMMTAIQKMVGVQFSSAKVAILVDPLCSGTPTATIELSDDGTYQVK